MSSLATAAFEPAADWPVVIVAVSLGLSLLLLLMLVAAVMRKTQGTDWLAERAPSPKWSFDSWATHLTAVGAVLGTVFGAATLPAAPAQIHTESIVALSLLFGALVVVAPFVFEAVRRWPTSPIPSAEEDGTGYVCVLLLACTIVFCGVFGELFTLGLIAWELTGGDTGGVAAEIGLGLLSLLAFYYVAVTAWEAAMIDWKPPAKLRPASSPQDAPEMQPALEQPLPEPRSSWSLP
jgi:hypothetical protein